LECEFDSRVLRLGAQRVEPRDDDGRRVFFQLFLFPAPEFTLQLQKIFKARGFRLSFISATEIKITVFIVLIQQVDMFRGWLSRT
jgi:hypothetical protein